MAADRGQQERRRKEAEFEAARLKHIADERADLKPQFVEPKDWREVLRGDYPGIEYCRRCGDMMSNYLPHQNCYLEESTSRASSPAVASAVASIVSSKAVELTPGGAKRDPVKTRFDLVPMIGLRRAAETAAHGAEKYGTRNWEKGIQISNCLNHALDHITAYLRGDRSEDHLGHATWNVMAACDSEERWPHLNNDLLPPGASGSPSSKPE